MNRRGLVAAMALSVAALTSACGSADDGVEVDAGPLALLDEFTLRFGIWDCTGFRADLPEFDDPSGISAPAAGLIRAAPQQEALSRTGATLGVFLDNAGLAVDDDAITMPDGSRRARGDDCDGSPGEVVVVVWDDPTEAPTRRVRTDVRDVVLAPDGGAIVLAFATDDTEIPLPPEPGAPPPTTVATTTTTTGPPTATAPPTPTTAVSAVQGATLRSVQFSSPAPCSTRQLPLGDRCLRVSDDYISPADVATATVVADPEVPDGLGVQVTFTPEGAQRFSALVAPCAAKVEPCRTGRLAVILDAEIYSLFDVDRPDYGTDGLILTGEYNEGIATALAAALAA